MTSMNPQKFTVELLDGTVMCEHVETPGQYEEEGPIFWVRMDEEGRITAALRGIVRQSGSIKVTDGIVLKIEELGA